MPLRHCTLHYFVPPVTSMAAARQALRVKARAAHLNLADSRAHLHLCLHRNKPRVASHSTAGRPLDCRSRLTEGSRAARRRELRRRNAGGRNPAGRRHHHSRARRGPAAPAPTPRAARGSRGPWAPASTAIFDSHWAGSASPHHFGWEL